MNIREDDKAVRAFRSIWAELFRSSMHLDSALSKQPSELKSELARGLQALLRRPVSEARALGLELQEGHHWSLSAPELGTWQGATAFFRAMRAAGHTLANHPAALALPDDFPPWLLLAWTSEWGGGVCQSLIRTLGEDPPLSLRASRKIGPAGLMERLAAILPDDVKAAESSVAPFGVRLSSYAAVLNSDAYREGLFEIQDEGSQVMALFALWPAAFAGLLRESPAAPVSDSASLDQSELQRLFSEPAPSWTVVDACAGAGGKTLALADALQGRGRVYAYDTSQGKVLALRKRASRAGLRNIQATTVEENNEGELVKRFRRRADVVLVDAPCSGWGVLRRNPDIKWRPDTETLGRMPGLQKRILTVYSDLVAPGGSLVFGVCTFRKSETLEVVKWFLERNPEFSALEGGYLGPGGTDGFFMQRFKREGSRK